jgi:dihydropteroate synthase
MDTKNSEIKPIEYACRDKTLTFIKPLIMAIVNITPDSFYDGGKFSSTEDVIRDVADKIEQGADIIDLGAASTRPNASAISADEEWKRLEPTLLAVRKKFPAVFISVDTYHAVIAKKSADLGADIINDIGGGKLDATMFDTIAALNLPYILMHLDGTPQTMQQNAPYADVLSQVEKDLRASIENLQAKGFNKLILDPGFGFGKSLENNYQLLKGLYEFSKLNFPLLAGISRKSMINKVLGTNPVTALNGTTVLNTIALLNGANILRVHDVKEAKQAIELVAFYKKA